MIFCANGTLFEWASARPSQPWPSVPPDWSMIAHLATPLMLVLAPYVFMNQESWRCHPAVPRSAPPSYPVSWLCKAVELSFCGCGFTKHLGTGGERQMAWPSMKSALLSMYEKRPKWIVLQSDRAGDMFAACSYSTLNDCPKFCVLLRNEHAIRLEDISSFFCGSL